MAGLLSGLEGFGLGNLEGMELFAEPEEESKNGPKKAEAVIVKETDFLFDKSFTCPVCDKEFKSKTVKSGKARLIGTDKDLRPKYQDIDVLKYDVLVCPRCGYATLSRYFKFITAHQRKSIKELISKSYKSKEITTDTYSYEDALERYKLALANAIVKQAKASEKAYICLKASWLLRGKGESMNPTEENYAEKKKANETEELEFLKNAFDGFLAARQTESFPMCGMDEVTVDYLIATMALTFKQYDVVSKLVSSILLSSTANARMKDRTRDLKEEVLKAIKKQQAGK